MTQSPEKPLQGMTIAVGASSFAKMDDTPKRMLEEAGARVLLNPFGRKLTEDETIDHLADAQGLIAGLEPLNSRVFDACPKLKALARVGIGMNNVDQPAAAEHGIKVSNTPDQPAEAVAELTLAALLALLRKLVSTNAALHGGQWNKSIGLGLRGLKVLLIGYGRIGRRTGRLMHLLGAQLLVCDPAVDKDSLEYGERLVSLEEGLREAQAISIHASGVDTILGAGQFSLMQTGVYLLNGARGELVDEAALIAALENGNVAGAWFDAFWQEPYTGKLQEFEQVLMTPHIGTYTLQCRLEMETAAVDNLIRDLTESA